MKNSPNCYATSPKRDEIPQTDVC